MFTGVWGLHLEVHIHYGDEREEAINHGLLGFLLGLELTK